MIANSLHFALLALLCCCATDAANPPHILFIVGDDIGWNDVSWNNPSMITPNLDALARNGVILNQSYVQPVCSPSRAAFLTGMYPFHLGMQHSVIRDAEPNGVPLNLTLLPKLLKQAGYATHMVGKWHLGFCKWDYTPTYRGFDSFFGYYNAHETYFDHIAGVMEQMPGLDFRENELPTNQYAGQYSTECFGDRASRIISQHPKDQPLFIYLPFQAAHFPLEAPVKYTQLYKHIKHPFRRVFSAMVTALDEAVGNVTNALKQAGLFDDTVIVFTSDNGGSVVTGGNNWPLRGSKMTLWEGGTRSTSFVHYPRFSSSKYTSDALVHAVDWMPTLLSAAGLRLANLVNYSLDGVDLWPWLTNQTSSPPRDEFVYNIDDINKSGGMRMGNYKLLVGNPGAYSGWYPPQSVWLSSTSEDDQQPVDLEETDNSFVISSKQRRCDSWNWLENAAQNTQLFDLSTDPEERVDLSLEYPEIVTKMLNRLQQYAKTAVPAVSLPPDSRANPKHWNNTWSPGWC